MPIVFVHGVNNRKGPGYDQAVGTRDALFRDVFLPAAGLPDTVVVNPYWGDVGVRFAFNLDSVPTGREHCVTLGSAGQEGSFFLLAAAASAAAPEAPRPSAVLITLARRDLDSALDLVYLAAVHVAEGDEAQSVALAAPLAQYALAHRGAPPSWLSQIVDDQQFILRLQEDLQAAEPEPAVHPVVRLGFIGEVWERVREGVDRLHDEAADFVGKAAWSAVRELLVPTVPRFLGDVFVYLEGRGSASDPGPIPDRMTEALQEGMRGRAADDPLIVVGHSLGGAIAYDMLSEFCTDVTADVLCTVGSQVGLLEEMKVLAVSDDDATGRKAAKPPNVERWINVFDYNDVLSYKLEPIFDDVIDYSYPSRDLLRAHGAYFGQPSFFQRLGTRVQEVRER
ncbi:hypothetical protein ABZT06_40040 [Streptomyces sp. NPDC005483]|uniref:hypothetical protein n=1 Tax=Streptomyces sp. NPDC005483 TaxID=3154882 RepID=UPI0033B1F614